MNFHRFHTPLLIALLAFHCLAGCVKTPPRTALDAASRDRAQSLLEQVKKRQSLRSLSAFMQVSLSYRGKKESFDAALLLEYPDRLRLELINDLGESIARLVANGQDVVYEDLLKGTSTRFTQGEDAFQKVFKLPLSVEEFIAAMSLQIKSAPVDGFSEDAGTARIASASDRLQIDTAQNLLIEWGKTKQPESEKLRYRIRYLALATQNGSPYPGEIEWEFFSPKLSLHLRLGELSLNPVLKPGSFQFH